MQIYILILPALFPFVEIIKKENTVSGFTLHTCKTRVNLPTRFDKSLWVIILSFVCCLLIIFNLVIKQGCLASKRFTS